MDFNMDIQAIKPITHFHFKANSRHVYLATQIKGID